MQRLGARQREGCRRGDPARPSRTHPGGPAGRCGRLPANPQPPLPMSYPQVSSPCLTSDLLVGEGSYRTWGQSGASPPASRCSPKREQLQVGRGILWTLVSGLGARGVCVCVYVAGNAPFSRQGVGGSQVGAARWGQLGGGHQVEAARWGAASGSRQTQTQGLATGGWHPCLQKQGPVPTFTPAGPPAEHLQRLGSPTPFTGPPALRNPG